MHFRSRAGGTFYLIAGTAGGRVQTDFKSDGQLCPQPQWEKESGYNFLSIGVSCRFCGRLRKSLHLDRSAITMPERRLNIRQRSSLGY